MPGRVGAAEHRPGPIHGGTLVRPCLLNSGRPSNCSSGSSRSASVWRSHGD